MSGNIKDFKTFQEMGIKIPELLFPKNMDIKTWATIACDQFTQDRNYWNEVYSIVGNKPSTVKITFPEVYLNDSDKKERVLNIKNEMNKYKKEGLFEEPKEEIIYLERTAKYGRIRHGLVTSIDLENYEWKPFSKKLIRATEATIVERIPPRLEIRREAPIEIPHIMLLINDPNHSVIESCGNRVKKKKPIYSGELMQNSGKVQGWSVKSEYDLEYLRASLEKIANSSKSNDGSIFLFAVGDGNHSLATAKAMWEEHKEKNKGNLNMKLRYALIEIVNIYDTGLTFEPIHRILFNTNQEKLIDYLAENMKGNKREVATEQELEKAVKKSKADFGFIYNLNGKIHKVLLQTKINDLAVSVLQPNIDKFMKEYNLKKEDIDFIHGTDEVFRLGKKEGAITILLPPIAKDSFFNTINTRGPLPRKSFSMGEADEKRFYLECRSLI